MTFLGPDPWEKGEQEHKRIRAAMNEKLVDSIASALASNYRVELLIDKGGNIVAQTIQRKRLKTE